MLLGAFELNEPVPKLNRPRVLACIKPWLDAGAVGTLCLDKAEGYFSSQPLGSLSRPGRFYDFTRARPAYYKFGGRRDFLIPNSSLYYSIREEGEDLIFLHIREPHLHGEELIESLLEVFQYLDVSEYVILGGMYDLVPHNRPLLVSCWDAPTLGEEAVPSISALYQAEERPASLMELLTEYAADLGIPTKTAAVHLPGYLEMPKNWMGVARLQEYLCELLDVPQGWPDYQQAEQIYQKAESYVETTPDAPEMLVRLEELYDRWKDEQTVYQPLHPSVERFLRELA